MAGKRVMGVLVFLIIAFAFAGCQAAEKQAAEPQEELVDTGSILVESSPGLAEVYIGEEYRGDTPVSLYNLPVGEYEITIRKEGYADFKKTTRIKAGRTEEINADLGPMAAAIPKTAEPAKEAEKPAETTPQGKSAPELNKINFSSFAMYYDFDNIEFAETRTEGSDLFSRKYENYLHFTILVPTKINVLSKPINEAEKEDCIFADTAVVQLFSAQTLCVKTGAGRIAAVGGVWQGMPTELELKTFG